GGAGRCPRDGAGPRYRGPVGGASAGGGPSRARGPVVPSASRSRRPAVAGEGTLRSAAGPARDPRGLPAGGGDPRGRGAVPGGARGGGAATGDRGPGRLPRVPARRAGAPRGDRSVRATVALRRLRDQPAGGDGR